MEQPEPEEAEELTDRQLASRMNLTENEAMEARKRSGVSRLEDFFRQEDEKEELEVSFDLGEMHRRQLQGCVGEKIAAFLRNRVAEFLENHLENGWTIERSCEVVSAGGPLREVSTGSRFSDIRLEGSSVRHRGLDEEKLLEKLEENCVALPEDLFDSFLEAWNPFIDEIFYGFRHKENIEKKFSSRDTTEPGFETGKPITANIPLAEDFKIMAVEVKTTGDRAEDLLTSNQREVRDMASRSPFVDFFTLHVDLDLEEIGVPDSVNSKIRRHQ
ncbi:MAG: hypothetical protein ABEJ03_05585 [Candidatus Nanohaloarchaea archaeon]